MMGIADIFEALTAEDGPCKQGTNLYRAQSILEHFSQNGDIDSDRYSAFVKNGVCRQ